MIHLLNGGNQLSRRLATQESDFQDDALERYNRAEKLLNDPNPEATASAFEAECRNVGACGHNRNWLFFSPHLYQLTRQILINNNIDVPEWHGVLYPIERMVEVELRETLEAEQRLRNHDYSMVPRISSATINSSGHAPNGKTHLSLENAVEKHITVTGKPIKTASKLRLVVRYIKDISGKDISLNELSKDVLLQLQEGALKMPARPLRSERNLTFIQIVDAYDNNDVRPRLTQQAVRSWFNLLGGCLNWAVMADLLAKNPTVGVKPKIKSLEIKSRSSFSSEDLKAIFDKMHYPQANTKAEYWLPILALYTGARLNELGQLLCVDVKRTPTPHLIISDKSEIAGIHKRLKNISSRRIIPLHPDLLKLGFLKIVQDSTGPYVFEQLPHGQKYEPTKTFSQWFGRYLRRVGVVDRTKVFHSFRHSFKDACRNAGIDEEVHDALTGHRNSKHVGRSYGSGVDVSVLTSAVSKLRWDISPTLTQGQ